jgi:hypothetical protein
MTTLTAHIPRDSFRLHPDYFALLICKEIDPHTLLPSDEHLPRVRVQEWTCPGGALLVLSAPKHQEPLFAIRDRVTGLGLGACAVHFVAALENGTDMDYDGTFCLNRLPTHGVATLLGFPGPERIFVDLRTGGGFTLSRTSGLTSPGYAGEETVLQGLVLSADHLWGADSSSGHEPTRSAYDPAGAYMREVQRSQSARLLSRISTLLQVTRDRGRGLTAPIHEHTRYLRGLYEEVQTFRDGGSSVTLSAVQGPKISHSGFRQLNMDKLADWIRHLHGRLGELEQTFLQQRVAPSEPLLGGPVSLAAVQNVFDSLIAESALARTSRPLATFSLTTRLSTLGSAEQMDHAWAVWMAHQFPTARLPAEATIVEFPSYFDARAGALPLLARPAAQSIFEDNTGHIPSQLLYDFYPIKRFVAQFMPSKIAGEDTTRLFHIKSPSHIHFIPSAVLRSIRHVVYDVLATLLMGPAYVYALLRFELGNFYQVLFRNRILAVAHGMLYEMSLRDRIAVCLRCLELVGIPTALDFTDLGISPARGDSAVDSAILTTPVSIYDADAHQRAVTSVKERLQRGELPAGNPRSILNALWDAVVRREEHVNELAVFLGVSGFPSGPLWTLSDADSTTDRSATESS